MKLIYRAASSLQAFCRERRRSRFERMPFGYGDVRIGTFPEKAGKRESEDKFEKRGRRLDIVKRA